MCEFCGFTPCVCSYVYSLLSGGRNEWLAETVAMMVDEPFPHRGGEGSCPCVSCYADRLRLWSVTK